jgi:hypothetical protein
MDDEANQGEPFGGEYFPMEFFFAFEKKFFFC